MIQIGIAFEIIYKCTYVNEVKSFVTKIFNFFVPLKKERELWWGHSAPKTAWVNFPPNFDDLPRETRTTLYGYTFGMYGPSIEKVPLSNC